MVLLNSVTLKAYAKVNLMLDVVGRRGDGYHELATVMQTVSLADSVTVALSPELNGAISISCSDSGIPADGRNIAYKAAEAFFSYTSLCNPGLSVSILKNIPFGAGLGGGSTDGAAVIKALDRLFGLGMGERELCEIGLSVGADVPFCIVGGTRCAFGIGERLEAVEPLSDCGILIAMPAVQVSTALAYSRFDELRNPQHPDISLMRAALASADIVKIGASVGNSFEQVTDEPLKSAIERIRSVMLTKGAAGAAMTGSGAAVFGLFADLAGLEGAADAMSKEQGITGIYRCTPKASAD